MLKSRYLTFLVIVIHDEWWLYDADDDLLERGIGGALIAFEQLYRFVGLPYLRNLPAQ